MNALSRQMGTQFVRDERGAATTFGLFLLATSLLIGGYAVDVSNVMTARTRLQIAADASAHAALLSLETMEKPDAVNAALDVALLNMPSASYGAVLSDADVQFGNFDTESATFTPDVEPLNSARVETRQQADNGNPISTHLLKMVGFTEWNVSTQSTFMTYHPTCLREGFVAEDVVDLQSNNTYTNGFCIHSNSYVSLNSNNYFEPGTVVSMPNKEEVELPNSGFDSNIGLDKALRSGSWNIRIVSRLAELIADLNEYGSRQMPAYITSPLVVSLPNKFVNQAHLVPGRIHRYNCTGGATLTINQNVVVERVVLLTNCKVVFREGVKLIDTVVATTNTSTLSVKSPANLQIGLNDNCAAGGGAQIITMGSMDFASQLQIYGGQLLARHNINFTANADGIQGVAMVAGGLITGTSNMAMGFCGTGMENNFHAEYFKLVQ